MKFQNSSIHGFKVMLCIKKRDERTEGGDVIFKMVAILDLQSD